MSLFAAIVQALNARLETYQTENVGWPSVPYTPRPQVAYLSARLTWSMRTVGAGADGLREYRGFYQINVYEPAGEGLVPAALKVDAIVALFPRGQTLFSGAAEVQIVDTAPQNPMESPVWVQIPVLVSWVCFEKP